MNKNLKDLINSINKKNGSEDNLVSLYGDLENTVLERVSTGLPSLDYCMGGGQPMGRIIEIFGPTSSGKTSVTIQMLISIQKAYPESYQVFIDVEHTFDGEYAKTLGLDMSKIIFSQPDSAEQALDLLHSFAGAEGIRAVVFDSLAQMPTEKEVNGKSGDVEVGTRGKLLSQSMRKLAPVAEKNKCIIYLINQVRTNIGQMFGNNEVTSGGEGVKFASSIRIRTTIKKDVKDPTFGITGFNIIKNKVGVPFRKTEIKIVFGKGFDTDSDLMTLALELGVIMQSGPSYFFRDFKVVGKEKLLEHFLENKDFREDIKQTISKFDRSKRIVEEAQKYGILDTLTFGAETFSNHNLMFKFFLENQEKLNELELITKNTML